jgi:ABC-type Na+ transport system ATPase subunit NatA
MVRHFFRSLFSNCRNDISSRVSTSAITIDSLEKWFPPVRSGWRTFLQPFGTPTSPALRGISLEVAQAEAVAVLGVNGAGKTTLLRILATLLLPTRGTALLGGQDAVRDSAAARSHLGYHAGSDLGFYSRLTGRENLRFFGRLNHLSGSLLETRIHTLSERFQLGAALDRQVRSLSAGTIQRLSLLRALLHQPKVLLLDEPTRSLDALVSADLRRFLKSEVLREHGTSILFSSHSLPEIELLANRVAILHEGLLIAIDSPAALKAKTGSSSLEQAFSLLTARHISTDAPASNV